LRYKAWGETRYTSGTTPTTYHFTGQREESTVGLYLYNARWCDAALARFVQADTLVPEPGNFQASPRRVEFFQQRHGAAGKQGYRR
jgi:RHS repeat-associated protein